MTFFCIRKEGFHFFFFPSLSLNYKTKKKNHAKNSLNPDVATRRRVTNSASDDPNVMWGLKELMVLVHKSKVESKKTPITKPLKSIKFQNNFSKWRKNWLKNKRLKGATVELGKFWRVEERGKRMTSKDNKEITELKKWFV